METLAEAFHIGKSTLYGIIPEVSRVIFLCLRGEHLPFPQGPEWLDIANGFEHLWDFPNCVGAIDTQQVEIKRPTHSGSYFYNYTQRYTMGLMGLCDAHKKFLWINVGSYGNEIINSKLTAYMPQQTVSSENREKFKISGFNRKTKFKVEEMFLRNSS